MPKRCRNIKMLLKFLCLFAGKESYYTNENNFVNHHIFTNTALLIKIYAFI